MPQTLLLPIAFVLFAGMVTAFQPPTNAILAKASGSAVFAAFLSFAVGTIALVVVLIVTQQRVQIGPLRDVPWYAWAGGLYGAIFVVAGAYAAPRLGVASLITIAVAGQLLAALAIDSFGGFGIERTPISFARVVGVALVVAGVVLVRRG